MEFGQQTSKICLLLGKASLGEALTLDLVMFSSERDVVIGLIGAFSQLAFAIVDFNDGWVRDLGAYLKKAKVGSPISLDLLMIGSQRERFLSCIERKSMVNELKLGRQVET